eukprot:jgi/Bigna1/78366/fgenesh1_pg.54_\
MQSLGFLTILVLAERVVTVSGIPCHRLRSRGITKTLNQNIKPVNSVTNLQLVSTHDARRQRLLLRAQKPVQKFDIHHFEFHLEDFDTTRKRNYTTVGIELNRELSKSLSEFISKTEKPSKALEKMKKKRRNREFFEEPDDTPKSSWRAGGKAKGSRKNFRHNSLFSKEISESDFEGI